MMVQNRSILGSAESRRLRKQGLIPGVLYGRERPVAISIPERDLRAALTGAGGTVTHVDLQEVRLDQPIHATVSLHLVGEAAGTKEGGVLTQVISELNVE